MTARRPPRLSSPGFPARPCGRRRWRLGLLVVGLASVLAPWSLPAAATAAPAPAGGAPPVAAGLRAGTAGLGVELAARVSERVQVRLAASRFGFDATISTPDLDYDADAQVAAALLLLDWYPAAGAFRLSVGGGWNGTEADVAAPLEDLLRSRVPGLPAIPGGLGTATGTARGEKLVPAALLGWGNPFRGGRWTVSFEVGAFYQGRPKVDLRVSTPLPLDQIPGAQEALALFIADQERKLEAELRDYPVVPVVSFAVGLRF